MKDKLFQLKAQAAETQDPLQIWAVNEIEELRKALSDCYRALNKKGDERSNER